MKNIAMENVCKNYGRVGVVKDLNLAVGSGEKLILLGPSGCGKSTILRMIAGLEEITSGTLYLGGRKANHVECGRRNVAMVFQNYALFPHMTVEDNITYGLKVGGLPKGEVESRRAEVVRMLELGGLEKRKPRELSGGQRQRVAVARAVARHSDFLLLDEPLSNLDAQLRDHARRELVKIHEKFGQTMVYVTHDQTEAMTVGDRIALLSEGRVKMLDTPANVYNRPANVFTARFIGSPGCNIAPARMENGRLALGKQAFFPGGEWCGFLPGRRDLFFGVRPEHVRLSDSPASNALAGRVATVENCGHKTNVSIDVDGVELVASGEALKFSPGETAYATFEPGRIHLFDRDTEDNVGYPENLMEGDGNESLYQYHVA